VAVLARGALSLRADAFGISCREVFAQLTKPLCASLHCLIGKSSLLCGAFIGVRMIKVTGGGRTGGARPSGGVSSSKAAPSGAFSVGESAAPASGAGAASAASEVASASALGALIALQSDGRNGARNRAMAERMLMLLDRLRDGLLSGRIAESDLAALANAADAKLDDPDEKIAEIYREIALRARVELAKIGRS
jgi:hypothetical protein